MPGLTQKAVSTLLRGISSRTRLNVMGLAAPARLTITWTLVPLGPLSISATSCGGESIDALVIDFDEHVAGANARFVGRGSTERMDDHGLVGAGLGADQHANAVIHAVLLFAKGRKFFGIKEIRVRIEGAEHARDGPFIDGLIGLEFIRVILVNDVVDLRKCFDTVTSDRHLRLGLALCSDWEAAATVRKPEPKTPPAKAQAPMNIGM